MAAQSWNPARSDLSPSTLTNSNLTFTQGSSTGVYTPFIGLNSVSTGKWYWEYIITTCATDSDIAFGFANTSQTFADGDYMGITTNSIGWFHFIPYDGTGAFEENSVTTFGLIAGFRQGDVTAIALDLVNHKWWGRVNGGAWNVGSSGTQDPATNQGGRAIPSSVYASPVAPAANTNSFGDVVTGRFTSASWSGVAPTGFASFDGGGIVLRDFQCSADFKRTVTRDILDLAEWRATFLRDSGGLTDFGRGVFVDRVVPREPLFNVGANAVIFDETGAAASVAVSASSPVEWLASIQPADTTVAAEWRGGILRDAIAPINFSSLFIDDQVANAEWGLSARVDAPAVIDFNMTRLASPVFSLELKETLFRDDASAFEPDAIAAAPFSVPTEWQTSAVVSIAVAPMEYRSVPFRDSAAPVESLNRIARDAFNPIDFGQPAQTSADTSVGLEFVSRMFAISTAPTEFGGSQTRTVRVPVAWAGPVAVTLDSDVSLEWRSVFTADTSSVSDWSASFTVDLNAPVSIAASVFVDIGTVEGGDPWSSKFSSKFGLSRKGSGLIEFRSAVLGDTSIGAETQSAFSIDTVTPAERRATMFVDAVVPQTNSGSATGVIGDASMPLAFGEGLSSPGYVLPIDSQAQLARNVTAPASGVTATLVDATVVVDAATSVSTSADVPVFALASLTVSKTTRIEWQFTGVDVSFEMAADYASEMVVDSNTPMCWTATISADVATLADWTQDTVMTTADFNVPLDFLSMTVVDVVVSAERGFSRESIGSSLEPDEWEKER